MASESVSGMVSASFQEIPASNIRSRKWSALSRQVLGFVPLWRFFSVDYFVLELALR